MRSRTSPIPVSYVSPSMEVHNSSRRWESRMGKKDGGVIADGLVHRRPLQSLGRQLSLWPLRFARLLALTCSIKVIGSLFLDLCLRSMCPLSYSCRKCDTGTRWKGLSETTLQVFWSTQPIQASYRLGFHFKHPSNMSKPYLTKSETTPHR